MLARYLPILDWGRRYDRGTLTSDLLAAAIVTIMLIPQSLAYAMLAGLPPVVGLYASILPLVAYAIFGTSRALAVGPVAVVSLLTATAAGTVAAPGSPEYLAAAIALALLSGLMLLAMGVFRLGFVANLLSHPVISGFITASGILIATSQLKHIIGVDAGGHTMVELTVSLVRALPQVNVPTLIIGAAATTFLFWSRSGLKAALIRLGVASDAAALHARTGPVLAVAVSILAVVKGPVMDRFARSDFVRHLTGRFFLSHHEALAQLAPETTGACDAAERPAIDAARVFPERVQRRPG